MPRNFKNPVYKKCLIDLQSFFDYLKPNEILNSFERFNFDCWNESLEPNSKTNS